MCAAVYMLRHLVKATEVTASLAASNGSLLPGLWRDTLHVTCGLTACTPGSALGPTLGNEYGKTLPLPTEPIFSKFAALVELWLWMNDPKLVFYPTKHSTKIGCHGNVPFRFIIYSHSYTNSANLAKIGLL